MISSKYKKLSLNSEQFIPEGVRDNSVKLEEILKAYYEWTETDGNFYKESKVLAESLSFYTASDNYMPMFKETLLRLFPDKHKSILKHLLKFSKSFYESRGTPESYEFLFRAVWDVDVKINNPSDYILRSSDGVWVNRKLMRIDSINVNINSCIIHGKTSGGRAVVSGINTTELFTEVDVENITGTFIPDEVIEFHSNIENKIIATSRTIASIISYKIVDPGAGYNNDKLIFVKTSDYGQDFSIKINTTDYNTGAIASLSILNQGSGYLYSLPELELDNIYLFRPNYKNRSIAVIELIEGVIYNKDGYYETPKSLLSDNWKISDGNYYQEFSYEIETELPLEEFYKPVMDLLHPAGTKMFYKRLTGVNAGGLTTTAYSAYTTCTEYVKDKKLRYSAPNSNITRFGEDLILNDNIKFTSENDITTVINVKKYGDVDAKYS